MHPSARMAEHRFLFSRQREKDIQRETMARKRGEGQASEGT
ncbi:hypothetical protein FHY20_001154 [Xanthomonas campestris]|nr:hypothetical protein [Xanthomonas cannabis]